jgi:hypothetical protein
MLSSVEVVREDGCETGSVLNDRLSADNVDEDHSKEVDPTLGGMRGRTWIELLNLDTEFA